MEKLTFTDELKNLTCSLDITKTNTLYDPALRNIGTTLIEKCGGQLQNATNTVLQRICTGWLTVTPQGFQTPAEVSCLDENSGTNSVVRAVCEEIETNQIPIPDYLKPSHSVTKALFLYPKDGYILCGGCHTFLKKYIKEYEKRISDFFDSLIDIKEPAE